MLPAAHRLRSSADFAAVTRRGRRARSGGVMVYLLPAPAAGTGACRVGLIVGKSVGCSVVRHRVSRRLRAQLGQRLPQLPAGATVVVRALPDAAEDSSADLAVDLDRALRRLLPARDGAAGPTR